MASPFAAQLDTNYCPEDDEVLQIKSILVEPTLRLRRLDDEIAELQRAIDKLAEERDGLETFVAAHKALISPVRRVPFDILQEIFIACIPTHRNCVMSASEPPVLLGRICSSWRAIALSTPHLWARLHIVEPPRGGHASFDAVVDEKVAQRLEIAKMWLGRSGQCPLSISFQSGPDEHNPFPTSPSHSLCGQFLQALIPFAPRWQHIRFAIPLSAFEAMIHLTQTDVPMLETVAFHPQSHFFHESMKWKELPILGSSRISGFSITADCFVFEKSLLRWHQLTDLAIEGPVWRSGLSIDMILHTLASCPELRSCKLAVSGIISEIQHSLVELQFLHTLELEFGNVALTATQLLDRLSLPGLLNFTLNGNRLPNGTPDAQLSLASFLTLCTQLESLKIDSNTFSKSSLLDSLRSLPSTLGGSPSTTTLMAYPRSFHVWTMMFWRF
ncbi:hypothetical protein MVEN_02624400 [Mycena venus]|uniref:F-box domain-containing protein n=1 Tax=Mycena venus TaxID=2733690 RepID=A0A8H6U2R6_9AGAR|nr:hypothetical protein MVEN_02624400 [Mycena venus]